MARSCRRRPGWPVRRAAAMRATSAAGPRGSRRPARSGPGLPRGTCRHRPLAARSRAAPPPRRARARSHPARSRAAAASTAISCVDIHQTYHRSGLGPAMAEFIALVSHQGPIPPGFADQPAPPRRFRVAGPGRRLPQRPALRAEHHVVPPLPARFRRAPRGIRPRRHRRRSRIQHDDRSPRGRRRGRTARDHARHLPGRPRRIPGGEYGRTGDPDAFAATLRKVLTS